MTWTSADRWTCPECLVTEVPDVDAGKATEAIANLQVKHGRAHEAERAAERAAQRSHAKAVRRARRGR